MFKNGGLYVSMLRAVLNSSGTMGFPKFILENNLIDLITSTSAQALSCTSGARSTAGGREWFSICYLTSEVHLLDKLVLKLCCGFDLKVDELWNV